MRQEERIRLVAFADRFDRVEILRHQNERYDVRGRCGTDGFLELFDRTLQPLDNGLALIGDALPLQRLALGSGFGL
jgi:hypothetical protein